MGYYDVMLQNMADVQKEEAKRYQAGLAPYKESTEFYKPGGKFSQTAPQQYYQAAIKPMLGGTGGALRSLFSTSKAGMVSMTASREAEMTRGQMYSQALANLGGATQRYPLMPQYGDLVGGIASEYASNQRQISASNPTNPPSPYITQPGTTGSGGGGGGGSSGGYSPGGRTDPSGGVSPTTPGSSSTYIDDSNSGLYMDLSGSLIWMKHPPSGMSMMTYVGGWGALKQYAGKNIPGLGTVRVDPVTGEVTNPKPIPTTPVPSNPTQPGTYGDYGRYA